MTTIKRITCVAESCGTFPMDAALVQQLKQSGETFTCPAGHEQHFTDSPNKQLKERIEELESKLETARHRKEYYEDKADQLYDDEKAERQRRKFAESRLLDYATGVVEVGEELYKWACACDARGTKAFDDVDACQAALDRHHRDHCPLDHDDGEVTVDVEE